MLLMFRALCAGEMIVREDFEKLDLKSLPLGYSTFTQDLSIGADPAQGKVLKISHKGADNPELSIRLDLSKVAGHTVRVVALAKMPGTFKPVDGKPEAQPELRLIVKDHDGADTITRKAALPEKPEWQRLSFLATIDRGASWAAVSVGLNLIAGDISFDDLSVEVDPDTRIELLAELATKAPARKLDMGGVSFSPEIAEPMQKFYGVKSAPNTMAFAGPGLPLPELETKIPAGWAAKTNKGLDESPRALLAQLPEFLAKEKPEIVFLLADPGSPRKLAALEALDWADLAQACGRMGAVPVLTIPVAAGNEEKDALRTAMLKAADAVKCPVIELGPGLVATRAADIATLIGKFIIGREPKDASGKKGTEKVNDE